MTTASNPIVQVTRRYGFPPERVFDAFLDTRMIGTWMFGPRLRPNEEIIHIEVDPRVGGTFSFLVRRDGGEIDHVGKYLEIDRPRRLVFTWAVDALTADDSRVTVEIVPRDGGCELTLTHEMQPEWASWAKRTEEGWTTMLGMLASILDESGRSGGRQLEDAN